MICSCFLIAPEVGVYDMFIGVYHRMKSLRLAEVEF